jgi:1-acyl-sn-glycerol-3-phosphate acyltransferase
MNRNLLKRLWTQWSVYSIMFFASVLNRCRVIGLENVPHKGGVILASNHVSAFETLIVPSAVIRGRLFSDVVAVAKEELFRNPVMGLVMDAWGAIPIRRGRGGGLVAQIAELARTRTVMIFPEGTRHKDGVMGSANRGVGKIIYEARPTVVPVGVSGLHRWKWFAVGQRSTITYGKPVDFSDLYLLPDVKETHVAITNRLMSAIAALIVEDPVNPA